MQHFGSGKECSFPLGPILGASNGLPQRLKVTPVLGPEEKEERKRRELLYTYLFPLSKLAVCAQCQHAGHSFIPLFTVSSPPRAHAAHLLPPSLPFLRSFLPSFLLAPLSPLSESRPRTPLLALPTGSFLTLLKPLRLCVYILLFIVLLLYFEIVYV